MSPSAQRAAEAHRRWAMESPGKGRPPERLPFPFSVLSLALRECGVEPPSSALQLSAPAFSALPSSSLAPSLACEALLVAKMVQPWGTQPLLTQVRPQAVRFVLDAS